MSKCSFNVKPIASTMAFLSKKANKEKWPKEVFEKNVIQNLDKIVKAMEITSFSTAATTIVSALERWGAPQSNFLSEKNIQKYLEDLSTGVRTIDDLEASIDNATKKEQEQIQLRASANFQFLDASYGLVTEAKTKAIKQSSKNIFDALFINRGSISNIPKGLVKSNTDLNRNIRIYKQQLLNKVVEYLKSFTKTATRLELTSEQKNALNNPILYDEDNQETDILNVLQELIDRTIATDNFRTSVNPKALEGLRSLYNSANLGVAEAKFKLDAYNANVILQNFDNYLEYLLGDIITINPFDKDNKYAIGQKTAKLLTSWTTSDDRSMEEEADFVTKLCMATTPLYNWQQDTPSEKFLEYQDYQHIVGKIKSLIFSLDVTFEKYEDENGLINDEANNYLSEHTKTLVDGKTFKEILANIRRNPITYLPVVFEILSSQDFYKKYDLDSIFSDNEKNIIYSLNKEIFGLNEDNSLFKLVDFDSEQNYFAYITQTADTIHNVEFVQYYRDQNGILRPRTFIAQDLNNVIRTIENTINAGNASDTITDINKFKSLYSIDTSNGFRFKIPGIDDIYITVNRASDIIFQNKKGEVIDNINFKNEDVQKFIDQKLRINLYNNSDLYKELVEQFGSENNASKSLLTLCSKILSKQYTVYFYKQKHADTGVETKVKEFFGDKAPAFNRELEVFESIDPSDTSTIRSLGIAKSKELGIGTTITVKDGEGNSLSLQTPSRLLGSHVSQFYLQEKRPDSATKDCLILNVKDLYKGVFVTKEYHDDIDGSKSFIDMNVDEFMHANFVYDFIGGLLTKSSERDLIGDGVVMFIPSVNSDKNTIDRIVINLNAQVQTESGELKAVRDFNNNELRWLIAKQFGNIYTKIYEAVNSDFETLTTHINDNWEGLNFPGFDYLSDFKNFNKWWFDTASTYGEEFTKVFGNSPQDFVKRCSLDYNQRNRLKPLEFIDQTYFSTKAQVFEDDFVRVDNPLFKVKRLASNQVIISQIARFKPDYLLDRGIDTSKYIDEKTFWEIKQKEVLKSLIKAQFQVNTSDVNTETGQKELVYLRNYIDDKGLSWVNPSGNVVLAKIRRNGQIYRITSETDLFKFALENNLYTDQFKFKDIIDQIPSSDLELHPLIAKWNYLDYLFTQEFMNCTVGTMANHPGKTNSLDTLVQEAACFQAQHKRNVSFTAAMHEFQLNQLNGISEMYNLAVIDDIHDEQGTIMGLLNDIKPFDGATFVNPFVVLLENFSLNGAKAGITKKQFVHFKNERTGTGGIIKTCGFGLTNDWMRNSEFLQIMMRKMTNHVWLNKNGQRSNIDITTNYKGQKIFYDNTYFRKDDRFFKIVDIQSLGGNQYKRVLREVSKDENGNPIADSLIGDELVMDRNGNLFINDDSMSDDWVRQNTDIIDTNYKLWNFFGGTQAMSVVGQTLEYSNSSVQNVVTAMNQVTDMTNAQYDADGNVVKINGIRVQDIRTQDELWQPLKNSDIHYVATAGAVKQGAANINSADKYHNDAEYDFQRIKMYQAGIQLDKEHHADDAELSLMTQVMSACAAKGYTFEAAAKLYGALKRSTEIGLKSHFDAVKQYLADGNSSNLREVMYEIIIKSLADSRDSNSFIYQVASELIEKARKGEKIKFSEAALPLSDGTLFSKIFSTVASYLTNTGIKQKIPGILSVLTPSFDIMKLYGGKKYEAYLNPKQELADLQLEYDANPVFDANNPLTNISNLELGRTYKIFKSVTPQDIKDLSDALHNPETLFEEGTPEYIETFQITNSILAKYNLDQLTDEESMFVYNGWGNKTQEELQQLTQILNRIKKHETRLIRTPLEYKQLKDEINQDLVDRVVEDVTVGRDLAAYNVRFQTKDGEFYQLWDLDSAIALFELNEKGVTEAKKLEIANRLFPGQNISLSRLKTYVNRRLQKDLMNLSPKGNLILDQYTELLKSAETFQQKEGDDETWYDKYARWVNIYFGTGNGNLIEINGKNTRVTTENFAQVRKDVEKMIIESTQISIGGKLVDINRNSFRIQPYEIILPKVFATKFGLKQFDSLQEIASDKDWFVEQYRRNSQVTVDENNYSIALKTSTGKHTYIMHKSQLPFKTNALYKINDENIGKQYIDGKILRIDNKRNILYEITEDFELYLDNHGNEVIVTDNIDFYINNGSFETIGLSSSLLDHRETFQHVLSGIKESTEKNAKIFSSFINRKSRGDLDTIYENSLRFNRIPTKDDPMYEDSRIIKSLREKHTSFLKSLDVVAARIPSQSMQSFMPMRVVAFDNPDVNTAFVSTMQILLQGSDYDVDAVSVAHFDISSNGKLHLYSPFANIESIELMEASMQLPIPTGKKIEFRTSKGYKSSKDFFAKYFNTEKDERGIQKGIFKLNRALEWIPVPEDKKDQWNRGIQHIKEYNKKQEHTPEEKELYNRIQKFVDHYNVNVPSETEVEITLNLKTPEHIFLLKDFLSEVQSLNKPERRYNSNFIDELNFIDGNIADTFTDAHIDSLFDKLAAIVDCHNLYYDKLGTYKLSQINNNISMQGMYEISMDPVNLMQAHVSVDSTTGPLKDKAKESDEHKELTIRTPGNAVNKFESITENQTGGKGIGICATGLKSFFGLTHYCNTILNSGNESAQKRLLIGQEGMGVTIGGKTYKTLANIRSIDLNTIRNSELFKALSEVTQDEDVALTLSALLSLATDNAKELALSKLNASPKMLGMYVYGLSIGMSFNDIADILMSPVGNIFKNLLNDNKFSGKQVFGSINEKVFNYFKEGPIAQLFTYNTEYAEKIKLAESPLKYLQRKLNADNSVYLAVAYKRVSDLLSSEHHNIELENLVKGIKEAFKGNKEVNTKTIFDSIVDKMIEKEIKGMRFKKQEDKDKYISKRKKALSTFRVNEALTGIIACPYINLNQNINLLESLRNKYKNKLRSSVEKFDSSFDSVIEEYNRLIDFCQDWSMKADVINKNQNIVNDIYKLSKGAEELKLIGQIFGLNQGIKTNSSDLLLQINNLRYAIYNKTENLEDIVDLSKFAFDDAYRAKVIDKYEDVKEAFNIFDAVANVPHFMEYVRTLATTQLELFNAFTFRSMDKLLLPTKLILTTRSDGKKGFVKEDLLARGIQNFCSDWLLKKWMLDKNITVFIPKGNLIFEKNGKSHTSTTGTYIRLGTDYGNQTFRAWIENEVIPNLKEGIITPNQRTSHIANNKFIKDLTQDMFNKTVSRNSTVIYTLPINMLPSSDQERSLFNQYKSEFNDLSSFKYKYNGTILDPEGKESSVEEEAQIVDLFTYYAMIANNWKLNQASLVSITEDFQNVGIIKELHDYIKEIDTSGFTLDLDNIIYQDYIPYIAQTGNSKSRNQYIWKRNRNTGKRELLRFSGSEYGQIQDNINLRYFGSGNISTGKGIFKSIEGNIEYDLQTGDFIIDSGITSDYIKGLISKLKEKGITKVPFKKIDKAKILDENLLNLYISNLKNPC